MFFFSFFRSPLVRFLSICIIISFILTLIIASLPTALESCHCENHAEAAVPQSLHSESDHRHRALASSDRPRLAIIVPFRDRFDELLAFAPHIARFLQRQAIPHHIFVVNQADRFRFNRAALINAGFLYAAPDYDYIAMHDVDLLPLNENLSYAAPPENSVVHVAAPGLHPKYNYPSFIGGILLVGRDVFRLVNGMSTRYWGWGLEDDEFYTRLRDAHIDIRRPTGISTGREHTFSHIHDRSHRRRDTAKCFNQREVTRKKDRETGLDTIKYQIADKKALTIDQVPVTVLNVVLYCDRDETPWCDCEGAQPTPPKNGGKAKKKL